MIRKLLYFIFSMALLTVASALFHLHIADPSGPGDEVPPEMTDETDEIDEFPVEPNYVMARLEYRNDVRGINKYFLEIQDHPGEGIDEIVGGFVATNFFAHVRLRGVSVPTACDFVESRHRPQNQVELERERWDRGLNFVQRLLMLNQSLRLSNISVEGEILVCDVEYLLGGAWHDLGITLYQDGFARPDEYDWNWGLEQLDPIEKGQ